MNIASNVYGPPRYDGGEKECCAAPRDESTSAAVLMNDIHGVLNEVETIRNMLANRLEGALLPDRNEKVPQGASALNAVRAPYFNECISVLMDVKQLCASIRGIIDRIDM